MVDRSLKRQRDVNDDIASSNKAGGSSLEQHRKGAERFEAARRHQQESERNAGSSAYDPFKPSSPYEPGYERPEYGGSSSAYESNEGFSHRQASGTVKEVQKNKERGLQAMEGLCSKIGESIETLIESFNDFNKVCELVKDFNWPSLKNKKKYIEDHSQIKMKKNQEKTFRENIEAFRKLFGITRALGDSEANFSREISNFRINIDELNDTIFAVSSRKKLKRPKRQKGPQQVCLKERVYRPIPEIACHVFFAHDNGLLQE